MHMHVADFWALTILLVTYFFYLCTAPRPADGLPFPPPPAPVVCHLCRLGVCHNVIDVGTRGRPLTPPHLLRTHCAS